MIATTSAQPTAATPPAALPTPSRQPSLAALQAGFASLLPSLRRSAAGAFGHLSNPQDREDAVALAVARAWQSYSRQGAPKDPRELARQAIRQARRELEGEEDLLSPFAQTRLGFAVLPLA